MGAPSPHPELSPAIPGHPCQAFPSPRSWSQRFQELRKPQVPAGCGDSPALGAASRQLQDRVGKAGCAELGPPSQGMCRDPSVDGRHQRSRELCASSRSRPWATEHWQKGTGGHIPTPGHGRHPGEAGIRIQGASRQRELLGTRDRGSSLAPQHSSGLVFCTKATSLELSSLSLFPKASFPNPWQLLPGAPIPILLQPAPGSQPRKKQQKGNHSPKIYRLWDKPGLGEREGRVWDQS